MSDGAKRDRFGAWLGFGASAHAVFAAAAMVFAPSDLLRLVQSLRLDQRAQFTTRLDRGAAAPTPTPPEPAVVEAPAITPTPPPRR